MPDLAPLLDIRAILELREAEWVDPETQGPSPSKDSRGMFIATQVSGRPSRCGLGRRDQAAGGQRGHRFHLPKKFEGRHVLTDKLIQNQQGFKI